MLKSEFDKLEINDTVFFWSQVFDCVASGCVTAIYSDSHTVYVEIRNLIFDEYTKCYNGSMTLGINMNKVYTTKEDVVHNTKKAGDKDA